MDPREQFHALQDANDFVFLVYFRGHWCPFCMSYLRQLQSITQAINAKKGAVVAVTAENEDQIQQTRKASGYTGTIIVDPAHLLATKLRELGILDVALTAKAGYEHDMAQPAILVMDGKQKKVLYKWAIVPSLMNLGGAKDRPDLEQVWANIEAQLNGVPAPHKQLKTTGALGLLRQKIFG